MIRHVNKTGEIKDFVITEESGIAKGIRRIVAVTGNEAAEVRRVADGLKTRLDQLEAMQGKEKDAGLKAYQVVRFISRYFACLCIELMLSAGAQPGGYLPDFQEPAPRASRCHSEDL